MSDGESSDFESEDFSESGAEYSGNLLGSQIRHIRGEKSVDEIDLSMLKEGYVPNSELGYRLVKRLGDPSGFGVVWKAVNPSGQVRAFKFCKCPQDGRSIRSFEKEADLTRRLDHPGIVGFVRHFLDHPNHPFLEYEYVDGCDLAKLLRERFQGKKPLEPDVAAAIILKIADIMAIAHSHPSGHIVHRDLKPQNILVANSNDLKVFDQFGHFLPLRLAELKIIDFGIGKLVRTGQPRSTAEYTTKYTTQGLYTPGYASYEQILMVHAEPAPADDVFAIGVIWYELLVGKMGQGIPSQWKRLLPDSLSDNQVALLDKCLEKFRMHRIADAAELAKEIREAYPNLDRLSSFSAALRKAVDQHYELHNHLELNLDQLHCLTVDAARVLARFKGCVLSLNGLHSISRAVAQELAEYTGDEEATGQAATLKLNGLKKLSEEEAAALAKFTGSQLHLGGLKVLSPEVAHSLAGFSDFLSLDGLNSINEETAGILAQYKSSVVTPQGDFKWYARGALALGGLEEISPGVAYELTRLDDELNLDLKTVCPRVARELAKFKGSLLLTGLEKISTDAAKWLATSEASWLSLDGIRELAPDVAEQLAEFKGGPLSLPGVEKISIDAAKWLATSEASWLSLDGLRELAPDVAEQLAEFKGHTLSLPGVEKISIDVAERLARFKGSSLELDGIRELAPDVAEQLAEFKGRELSLPGVEKISIDVAERLARFKGSSLELNGLKGICLDVAKELMSVRFYRLRLSYQACLSLRPHCHDLLHRAAKAGSAAMVELLVDTCEADPNRANKYGSTPLHVAVAGGQVKVVESLINHHAALDVKDSKGKTPLLRSLVNCAIDSNTRFKIVELLVKGGADVNQVDSKGNTLLHLPIFDHCIELLLENGADVNAKNIQGRTPLYNAIAIGNYYAVKVLLDHNADVHQVPLFISVSTADPGVLELLLHHGVDVNAKNSKGSTFYHEALWAGDARLVEVFLKAGADANAKSSEGEMCLHYALETKNINLARVLLEHGADLKAKTSAGLNAIDIAYKKCDLAMIGLVESWENRRSRD